MQLRRCLHITNPASYEYIQKGEPGYDKVRQVKWLVDEICNACRREWSLGKFLTIGPLQRFDSTIYVEQAREVGDQVLGSCRLSFKIYLLL
jgi:predicted Mrr-cat superfamily restriction endonuclease